MSKEFLAEVNEAMEEHKELLEKLGSKRPMIELKPGRSVKWQDGDAWKTGSVVSWVGEDVCGVLHAIIYCLVRDSCTSKLFMVKEKDLQPNTCRADERKQLADAYGWFSSQKSFDFRDVCGKTVLREIASGVDLVIGDTNDAVVLEGYRRFKLKEASNG